MSCVRKRYREQGFSRKTVGVLMASWISSTKKQYRSFIKRWIQYCNKRKISFLQPDLDDALQFLTDLFESALSYSSLNTARGALSSLGIQIEDYAIGKHPQVIRFLRGVYNLRPTLPRYTHNWDVDFEFLKKVIASEILKFKRPNIEIMHVNCIDECCKNPIASFVICK